MRSKAFRRNQRDRIKAKRIRDGYWGFGESGMGHYAKDPHPRLVGISIDTPHPCSGSCCGNPRKHFNALTNQEISASEDARQQYIEHELYADSWRDEDSIEWWEEYMRVEEKNRDLLRGVTMTYITN